MEVDMRHWYKIREEADTAMLHLNQQTLRIIGVLFIVLLPWGDIITYASYETHNLVGWLFTVSKVNSITISAENRVEGRQIGK